MSLVTIHGPATMFDNEEHVAYAGTPGTFASSVLTDPADLAELRAEVGASPNTPWFGGQYVVLVDTSHAYWDGNSWEVGEAPAFTNAEINGVSHALANGSTVWWNNAAQAASSWSYGVAPEAAAFAGIPGVFNPLYYKPATINAANTAIPDNGEGDDAAWVLTAVPGVTTYVVPYVIVGAATQTYWDGTDFIAVTGLDAQAADLATLQASNVVGGNKLTVTTVTAGDGSHNEKQRITPSGISTGGQWKITWEGQTTAPIAYNADAYTIKLALEALSNIGVGEVVVTGGPIDTDYIEVEFRGSLGLQNQDAMTVTTWLTRGAWTVTLHDDDTITCETITLGDASKAYWDGAAWIAEADAITPPADLATLLTLENVVASPSAAWAIDATAGDPGTLTAAFVTLDDSATVYWDGETWITTAEAETMPTGIVGLQRSVLDGGATSWRIATPGAPGSVDFDTIELADASLAYWDGDSWLLMSDAPTLGTLAALNAADVYGGAQTWINGDYIVLGDNSHAFWDEDGAVWTAGEADTATGTAGTPGTITPAGYLPADLAGANADLTADPLTAWDIIAAPGSPGTLTADYVVLGDASHAYWNDTAWVTEAAAETMPANLGALQASDITAAAAFAVTVTAGAPGTPVAATITLGDASKACWDGDSWVSEATYEDATQFADLAAIQASNWTGGADWASGEHIVIAAAAHVHWNGAAWAAGDHA